MGYEPNEQATDTRLTVDPDRATHVVKVHLNNDSRHHATWTRRAQEIRENLPGNLSTARAALFGDGTLSITDAVRIKLADEIRDKVEDTFETIHMIGSEGMFDGATVPGLMQSALARFVAAVRWQDVARGFMPDDE
jgi:hypothetical protein